MNHRMELCIVVLSGIPGVGKTHLTTQLKNHPDADEYRLRFISIEYDKLLPPDMEKLLIEQTNQGVSSWKQYRAEIVRCLDCFLQSLLQTLSNNDLVLSPPDGTDGELWERFSSQVKCEMSAVQRSLKDNRLCIIVDDNMYYRSMRYSFYQLARKYTLSFCQVHLKTDTATALQRNSLREVKVNDDVITAMALKMESPDPTEDGWEKHSICLESKSKAMCVTDVLSLINTSLCEPVQPMEVEDEEIKNQSRLICSESFIHQSDQILRRLVGEQMQQAKERHLSKEQMRSVSESLQNKRKQLLASLKDGTLIVPDHLVTMAIDVSKHKDSELFDFLRSQLLVTSDER